MNARLLSLALACCLAVPSVTLAQAPAKKDDKKAPAPKTPADLAFDEFQKVRGEPASRQGQAGFQKLIGAGMNYLTQYPTHSQVGRVINELGLFASTSIDGKQPALRASFLSLLKLEIANQRYKEGVTDPVTAALAALDAAAAECEMRINSNRDTLVALREKIDALAETPGANRFLADRERAYAHIMVFINQAPRAEEHLKKLTKHSERGVANMAREELNIIEARKAPYELKFTALDGKEVDLAQMRGKVVALYFWNTSNRDVGRNFEALKLIHSDYRKRGLEVVTVSYDKEEDREKLAKFIKDNRITWPVYFDGKAAKNDFGPKLNVSATPRLLLFDQKGMLQLTMQGTRLTHELPLNQFEGQVKKLLNVK